MIDSGYGIAPNTVLYDTTLPDAAFRLFVIISSHCAERGYCWASNEYLGNLMGKEKTTVSRLIKSLDKYIEIEDGQNERRKIRLRKNAKAATQKSKGSLRKNAKHNITKKNTKEKVGKPISVEKYLATHYVRKPTPSTLPSWVIDERQLMRDNENNTK